MVQRIPEGDQHLRAVCDKCGFIHYVNPKVVAGCLLTWEGKILLARRAIEPRKGFWTLPAGFMELQESTAGSIEGIVRWSINPPQGTEILSPRYF